MDKHRPVDREIAQLSRAVRRLAVEAAGDDVTGTPLVPLDFGYDWTHLAGPTGEDAGLWVRSLVIPPDYEAHVTVLLFDWRGGAFPAHKHAERETLFCACGQFVLTIEGEDQLVEQGETVSVPPLVRHAGMATQPCLLVGVYEPALPLIEREAP